MSSINTNFAAMTALKTLQSTQSSLETTQSRISTGFRVNEASDNAAYWSIATTMRSDNKALSTVQDALGLGQAKVDVAYTGLNAAIDVVDQIKTKLVAAREPGVDRTKIQSEIGQLQEQLGSIAKSSSFSGENWLSIDNDNGDPANSTALKAEIVASFNRSGSDVKVSTLEVNVSDFALFNAAAAAGTGATARANEGLLDAEITLASDDGAGTPVALTTTLATLDVSVAGRNAADTADVAATNADIDIMISGVETALQGMTSAAASLGASKARIDIQSDFIGSLMGAIDQGVSSLVDADMTAESTRLSALQTQQQLGIQALSIANGNAQSILGLFR